ncbi:MAG: hypothetical protein Q7R96_03415 [Nanoarchaeota archaeon]|nr:hypothetical protein [Nanoarchaeota archaeon]
MNNKGFIDWIAGFPAVFFFLILALIFTFINIYLAKDYQENVTQKIAELDDQTMLNALLNYPHQGKTIATWIIQERLEQGQRRTIYQSIYEEGIKSFFKNSDYYITIQVRYPYGSTPVTYYQKGFMFTEQPIPFAAQRSIQDAAKEQAYQTLPYDITVYLGAVPLGVPPHA